MKKIVLIFIVQFVVINTGFSKFDKKDIPITAIENTLYQELNLSKLGLSEDIFIKALNGWKTLCLNQCIENKEILTIADLSQSSNHKRLYIIDLVNKKIVFNTYVAHGKNSGEEFAHSFSNTFNSYQSSLGFYVTDNLYYGAHGLSLKLKGIEIGINHEAESRGIVIHGADYVSESFITKYGRLGRSQGCPAVSSDLCEPIVTSIKGGSCFFMFYPDQTYFDTSELI